jgi:hypothetical protein
MPKEQFQLRADQAAWSVTNRIADVLKRLNSNAVLTYQTDDDTVDVCLETPEPEADRERPTVKKRFKIYHDSVELDIMESFIQIINNGAMNAKMCDDTPDDVTYIEVEYEVFA